MAFTNSAGERYISLCLLHLEVTPELWSQKHLFQLSQQGRAYNHCALPVKYGAKHLTTYATWGERGSYQYSLIEHYAEHSVLVMSATGGVELGVGHVQRVLVTHRLLFT